MKVTFICKLCCARYFSWGNLGMAMGVYFCAAVMRTDVRHPVVMPALPQVHCTKATEACLLMLSGYKSRHMCVNVLRRRYFSWGNLAMAMGVYCATGMLGITFCYHRMLTHR